MVRSEFEWILLKMMEFIQTDNGPQYSAAENYEISGSRYGNELLRFKLTKIKL